MKLTKKMKDYSPLTVPLSKPIEELTIAETKKYNEWFVQNIDSRVDYLITKVAVHFGLQKTDLIYTTDSLFYIWKWFLEISEISKTKKNILRDLRKNLLGQPKSFINHIINQNKTESLMNKKRFLFVVEWVRFRYTIYSCKNGKIKSRSL